MLNMVSQKGRIHCLPLLYFLTIGCGTIKSDPLIKNALLKGRITDLQTGEPMIGATIYEFENIYNIETTDLNGYFEIKFQDQMPYLVLSGYYNPLIFEIKSGTINELTVSKRTWKKSERLRTRLSHYVKSHANNKN